MKTSCFLMLNLLCALVPASIGYAISEPSRRPVLKPLAPTPKNYLGLATQVESNLQTHVLNQWFPRAINTKRGGYDQNFGENWQPDGTHARSIVYQSRLTWLAAQAAWRYPQKRVQWIGYSNHGAKFLKRSMWDAKKGGFFWALNDDKTPDRLGEKHAYGMAFAIYALSANYRAARDKSSLELAQKAFRWLDKNAHDAKNGGYYEALTRSGKPILVPLSKEQTNDTIGTRYG